MNAKERVLAAVRKALDSGHEDGWIPQHREEVEISLDLARQVARTETPATLQNLFEYQLRTLGDTILRTKRQEVGNVIRQLVEERKFTSGIAESEVGDYAELSLPLPENKDQIFAAEYAVVLADVAIAETGTLGFIQRAGRSRLVSLAPGTQFVLLPASALVADVVDGLEQNVKAQSEDPISWVTGSSRTADIDGILIHGAHGPKELVVLLLTDC